MLSQKKITTLIVFVVISLIIPLSPLKGICEKANNTSIYKIGPGDII